MESVLFVCNRLRCLSAISPSALYPPVVNICSLYSLSRRSLLLHGSHSVKALSENVLCLALFEGKCSQLHALRRCLQYLKVAHALALEAVLVKLGVAF